MAKPILSRNAINRVGQRFGRLTVVQLARSESTGKRIEYHRTVWLCECDCGTFVLAKAASLARGYTTSCHDCFYKRPSLCPNGIQKHPLFIHWREMMDRSGPTPRKRYKKGYWGRGIRVCKRWWTFDNFVADMWPKIEDTSLDRIDNDRGYSPSNCRWATPRQQMDNTRLSCDDLTYNGRTQSVAEWADELGMTYATLKMRVVRGWPVERVLETRQRAKSTTYHLQYKGKDYTLKEIAEHTGLSYRTVHRRIIEERVPLAVLLNNRNRVSKSRK